MIKVETTAKKDEYKVTKYKEATTDKGEKVNVEDLVEILTTDILLSKKTMAQNSLNEEKKLLSKIENDILEIDQISTEILKSNKAE